MFNFYDDCFHVEKFWCAHRLARLHYVRSHGSVPQLTWERHTLSVFSDPPEIIAKPKDWSMDELSSGNLKVVEMPITFGCDGSTNTPHIVLKFGITDA